MSNKVFAEIDSLDVAVIGMVGRFPGAKNLDAYWQNLKDGVESISFFSDEEILSSGMNPGVLSDPNYVKARGILEDIDLFDAPFFGFAPREAEVMDPQHRLFLECAWQALESAGYDPEMYAGLIGLFAGTSPNYYLLSSFYSNRDLLEAMDLPIEFNKDYMVTVSSYKLNLKGPSIAVQTFCSTSLVAVHLARQSLLNEECDMALAGGVSIRVPQRVGYVYQEGGILSSDGHVRAFDARANGTIFSNGVGVVVLKRLADAVADGDCIYAVIKGSAINNDGSLKVSYTAPSVNGQAEVIVEALADAGVDPETISYIETHGTGTTLGDPIEISALTKAFGATSIGKKKFCAIGSVKANIGHPDAAAGIAGFIKTVLALNHKLLPPSINFESPNPKIDLANSPFYVNTVLSEWKTDGLPRRAGVSAFGFGGTNVHIVLEEAPTLEASGPSRPWQLLALSAKTNSALDVATDQLADHFKRHRDRNLADAAYTLLMGRRAFNHRRIVVCRDLEDAVATLEARDPERVFTTYQEHRDRPLIFMFPGQGAQYVNMGRGLYEAEPLFQATMDRCVKLLEPHLGFNLLDILYPDADGEAAATERLDQTAIAQPALFAVEYALGKLWQAWGLQPSAMIGHSIGEYVAACLAGVFSLEDALTLVATRGRLMQEMPPGSMLSVPLAERDVQSLLNESLAVATINGPSRCVVSGPTEAIVALEQRLAEEGINARRLHTSHAFHSPMMDPILKPFEDQVRQRQLHEPQIPYISNVTGAWVTPEQATDPAYWARHLRQTVRFSAGVSRLIQSPEQVLLEVGPGRTLSSLAQRHPGRAPEQVFLSSMRHPRDVENDSAFLLRTLGQLWLAGVTVDWSAFYQNERRLRVPLPTYPFERQRYWIEPTGARGAATQQQATTGKKAEIADWFYEPVWETSTLPKLSNEIDKLWLILGDSAGWGVAVGQQLREQGASVVQVQAGESFAREASDVFSMRPDSLADYRALLDALEKSAEMPTQIVHMWSLSGDEEPSTDIEVFQAAQRLGFYSLLHLAQALGERSLSQAVQIAVVSSNLLPMAEETVSPEKATILGPCLVIPQEYQVIRCRAVDVAPPLAGSEASAAFVTQLVKELTDSTTEPVVTYRADARYVRRFVPRQMEVESTTEQLRPGGVYMIVGGLGNIGLTLAEHLAQHAQARLVLTSRSGLPPRETWDDWLAGHSDQDSVSHKIQALRRLEAAGSQVLVLAADLNDEVQMRAAIDQAHTQFGPLNGVIHAAGLVNNAVRPIQIADRPSCEDQFAAKVYGLYVLDKVLQGEELDLVLLCSSLSAVLGGIGFAAYAAANLFMDAFAHNHNRHSPAIWTSVNWDTWDFEQRAAAVEFAMTPEEGKRAFALAMRSGVTQLVHSTGDLQARFRRWVQLETVETKPTLSLAAHPRPSLGTAYVPASSGFEKQIAAIWQDLLGIEQVGIYDNFFDLGGDSVLGLQVISKIRERFDVSIPTVALYEAPTVSALTEYLQPQAASRKDQQEAVLAERRRKARQKIGSHGVAIISMAGYFPGARTVEQLWENLCNGEECITSFTDEELRRAGINPELIANPDYVKARPIIEDIDLFDAAFFGYSPREAELLDPQYRVFLECAWEALERSGYNNPKAYQGEIGVFAGVGLGSYYIANPQLSQSKDAQLPLTADKDAFATTVSYKLDLRGPSLAIQTFCSTSLVATHFACQSLLNGECDVALAGGVTIRIPQQQGHLYQEGGMESPDGHCRPFGDQANGMVFGDGVGVVVLKRLEDALEDGDVIHAVIKGSAVNNDGALKVGYTAPSVTGQAKAVSVALDNAGVYPETISYVEAHGSATKLGDPIEVEALTQAFRQQTDRKQYCAIGSVKGNVGHLDRAAGVTGLIKAVLAVKHGAIPPSLHFERPNPEIDFENSPFFVNTELLAWPLDDGVPRRAGVNSLGLGGTNAHVIVEEPPKRPPSGPSRPWQLLLLSARTEPALEVMTANLVDYLRENTAANLADVAYTLQVGRRTFSWRRLLVCQGREDALGALESGDSGRVLSHRQPDANRQVAFMFPGIGDHYEQMARELYEQEAIFREVVEQCNRVLQPYLGVELRELLYTPEESATAQVNDDPVDLRAMLGRDDRSPSPAMQRLRETAIAHPVVFVIEYALARLLMAWGIQPQAMVGYSLGEYVAACLSGVLSLRDALKLVAKRAQMIQALPAGSMLAVSLSEEDVQPLLTERVSLAAHNGQATSVLAGQPEAIDRLEAELTEKGTVCRRLDTTHAFHSSIMTPLVEQVTALVKTITLNPPQIPYLSNVTGTWITAEEATDPHYWARHMCQTIRFSESLGELLREEFVLLEVGPGQALGSFAKQHPACSRERASHILPTMRTAYERRSDLAILLETVGKLWMVGLKPDWSAFYQAETRHLQPLPTYPFERQSYWIGLGPGKITQAHSVEHPDASEVSTSGELIDAPSRKELADWFYVPGWRQTAPHAPDLPPGETLCWLLFADEGSLATQVAAWLTDHNQTVAIVQPGEAFKPLGERRFAVRPQWSEDYVALLSALREQAIEPAKVVHMWSATANTTWTTSGDDSLERALELGFNSLLALVQAIGELNLASCELCVVSSQVLAVTGHESLCPEKATLIGPCRVVPFEYPNIVCRFVDVDLEAPGSWHAQVLLTNLIGELTAGATDPVVALRRHQRWVVSFEPLHLPPVDGQSAPVLRSGGVYLVTGGLGGIGLAMAEHLARTVDARLVLISRSGLPPRAEWAGILATQGSENGVGRKIRHVQDLEARGTQVLALAADVADEAQMRAAVEQAVAQFGTLHGVIHAAGVPGRGLIQLKTLEMAAQVLAPKVHGTLVLERALRGIELDFLVLFSSSTSINGGGPGQVDYCAANAFMDAYAQRHVGDKRLTISIDWGEWKWNAWEEGLAGLDEEIQDLLKKNRERFGITFQEGGDALERILWRGLPQVVVSTQDFRQDGRVGEVTIASILNWRRESDEIGAKHPRPVLGVPYIAPRDELEQKIAAVWSEVLGVSEIGINDNFFELGGNSLIGLDLVRRLQKALDIERVPARVLYEAPSVSALAKFVNQDRDSMTVAEQRYSRGEKRRQVSQQRKRALRKSQQ